MDVPVTRRAVLRGGAVAGMAAGAAVVRAGMASAADAATAQVFAVADYGAHPDDGVDDRAAIQRAINAAIAYPGASVVSFEAGVYNLTATSLLVLRVVGASGVTLRGAVTPSGGPATVLEVNLPLQNDPAIGVHVALSGCTGVALENLVLDYNPRFGTSGVVVAVDPTNDAVEVDVFAGLPHFDGMRCYSANSWDLASLSLNHVPPLTSGTEDSAFTTTWSAVPGGEGRRYRIGGYGFAQHVSPGDGMSWHFGVEGPTNLQIMDCIDTRVENVAFPNAIGMCCLAGYNTNLTLRRIAIAPTKGALAVGPRDGFHLSNSTGALTVDRFDVSGVRWDPLVLRSTFGEITAVDGLRSVTVVYPVGVVPMPFDVGDLVTFWSGDTAAQRTVASVSRDQAGTTITLGFTGNLPPTAVVGTALTNSAHEWTTAVITDSTFADNIGTPLVIMNPHVRIERCTFVDNAYHSIGLGSTSEKSGPFARGITIRDNTFLRSGWLKKYPEHAASGAVTTLSKTSLVGVHTYNSGIDILANRFVDMAEEPFQAAVEVRYAHDVLISGNSIVNVSQRVVVDPATTGEITNEDG